MGYRISQIDSQFTIKKENQEAAFQAVKTQMSDDGYRWCDKGWKKGLRDIYAVLEYWGYEPDLDDTGDIVDVQFSREKLGDEIELFKVIAPYVDPGSFIEMEGEEGEFWSWKFDGTTCTQEFEEDEEEEDYDVTIDEEFKGYASQINEKLKAAAALIHEAAELREKAGLPMLIDSTFAKEELTDDVECNKFEQRINLIDVSEFEQALYECGWNPSSSYC